MVAIRRIRLGRWYQRYIKFFQNVGFFLPERQGERSFAELIGILQITPHGGLRGG